MAAQTIDNYTVGTSSMKYHGSKTLVAGASAIIWTNGFPGAIGVLCGATKSFTVQEITDSMEAILAGTSTDIQTTEAAVTANTIVQMKWGVSAYKIINGGASSTATVNGRIIKP